MASRMYLLRARNDAQGERVFEFLDHADRPGPFERAKAYDAPPPSYPGYEAIETSDLVDALSDRLTDRSELRALPDFRCTGADVDGNPLVWGTTLHCPGCSTETSMFTSGLEPVSADPCPSCGAERRVLPDTRAWVGPQDPALRNLWRRLPPATFYAVGASSEDGVEALIEAEDRAFVLQIVRPRPDRDDTTD